MILYTGRKISDIKTGRSKKGSQMGEDVAEEKINSYISIFFLSLQLNYSYELSSPMPSQG